MHEHSIFFRLLLHRSADRNPFRFLDLKVPLAGLTPVATDLRIKDLSESDKHTHQGILRSSLPIHHSYLQYCMSLHRKHRKHTGTLEIRTYIPMCKYKCTNIIECVYIRIHTYPYIDIHIHIYVFIYIYIYTSTYLYIDLSIYLYLYVSESQYVYISIYLHIYISIYIYVYLYIYIYKYVYLCIYIYPYI